MNLTFLGAAQMVTGSCYLLETRGYKIIIDCGLFQGSKHIKEKNYNEFPFSPKDISLVLLTHAHTDHSGLIPKLYKNGYTGPVYTTNATIELCKIMLPDSGHIQEMEVERKNRKFTRAGLPLLTPIYTSEEAADCLNYFKGVEYREKFELLPGLQVCFQDAGHILGSAMIEVWVTEGEKTLKFVFSGDIGNAPEPYLEQPTCIADSDYLIMESTYGNRLHGNTSDRLNKFRDVINETFAKGGNLVIPSFAIERTQDLLYYLEILHDNKDIPPVDVYIDSPLAVEATKIFRHSFKYFNKETQDSIQRGEDPLNLPRLHFSLTAKDSMAINEIKGKAIIISASGMADAGRIKHHLKHNLWRSEATVLFVGYQAEGTLGRRLLNGDKQVTIHGEEISVKANIENIDGFSAHADQRGLLNWIQCSGTPAEGIILVHGEEEAQSDLAQKIKDQVGIEPLIPSLGETFHWNESGMTRSPKHWSADSNLKAETAEIKPMNDKNEVSSNTLNEALTDLMDKIHKLSEKERQRDNQSDALRNVLEIRELVDNKLRLTNKEK
ncbi:putative exonuclease of the beta-lactamase fold involved in RNA processing [Desulfosporosinus acidiphilus SJ4]|uniref:Putative exonuclease of the beta-lactamase fold involved in RNA processing n=1 Tax=Desulfosporosinus acidiphilus (strain DSM 22704 / JCM 16185 / SJ4) TaxID=646529 RepID=I4D786_DESAJ|nr:MBL fold metallo-hydrolase [Desulfosporosinus acidiphilus]AFM41660.1 putative exonuclease of the beta-lactamase fold involved in RNA processing [Desulfosporosinus acidiphilus SJ4]